MIQLSGPDFDPFISVTDAGRRAAAVTPLEETSQRRPAEAPQAEEPQAASDVAARAAGQRSRSAQFVDILRAADFGPFMDHRTATYTEIDRLVKEGAVPLKDLVSRAVSAVRASASDVDEAGAGGFPWSRLRRFIETLMAHRPVAVSDGDKIALTWRNGDRAVDALEAQWQNRLDGEIVLFLVDNDVEITLHDLPDLAGSLYGSRDEGYIQRAYDVVALLIDDGLLADDDWGTLRRRDSVGANEVIQLPQRPA